MIKEQEDAERMLEPLETQHKKTFLVNGKRFVIKKHDGLFLIDDETDDLISIDYSRALSDLHPEMEWIFADSGEYEGEWVAAGKDKDGIWYYKRGSYGSCSGCDWFKGIKDKEDAINYIKAMMLIDKVGDKQAILEYLTKEKANGWGNIRQAIDKLSGKLEGH